MGPAPACPLAPPAVRCLSLVILLLSGQDPGTPGLIRKLGSADPAERTAAFDRLKEQGEAARPGLLEAVRDPDSEVAARAGTLLRRIDIRKGLPQGVPDLQPESLDRLAQGLDPEWVSLYLAISRLSPRSSEIRRWLERYAPQAFRSADTSEEKKTLCETLAAGDRRPFREVVNYLRDPGEGVREKAVETLARHAAFETGEALAALLEDPDPLTRGAAARTFGGIFEYDALGLLLPLLGDPSPEVRRSVLSTRLNFSWEGADGAAKWLIPLLQDPDEEIRGTAAMMLGAGRSRAAVGPLISALEDKAPFVRIESAETLGKLRAAEAAPVLLDRLRRDSEIQVRRLSAWALGETAFRGAIQELLAHAEDPKEDASVRAASLDSLSVLKAPQGLKAARLLLANDQPELRLSAVRVLLALEDRPSADALALLFKDKTDGPVNSVVDLLVQKSPAWMVDPLTALLEDSSWTVRKRALLVLRTLKSEKSMPAIVRRLADDNPDVQDAAMLGRDFIRSPEAARELRKLFLAGVPDVRRRAVENTLPLLGAAGAEDLAPLLDDPDPAVRAAATRILGGLERPQDLAGFVRHLEDPEPAVRESAAKAILEQRAWESLPRVRALAAAGPQEVRPNAVRLLADLGASEFAPQTVALLASGDPAVQMEALQILGSLASKERVEAVLPLLESADPQIRIEALGTLAAWGAREALPRIRPLLRHPDPSVRAAALQALADLDDRESIPAVLKMLGDEDPSDAGWFLASIGAREAVPLLEEILETNPACLHSTLRSLARLGSTGSARKVFAQFGMKAEWGGRAVVDTLGVLGAREFIPELRKYLRHRSWNLRGQAAALLGQLRAVEAVPDLIPLLQDREDAVVAEAAEALGRIGAREAVPGIRAVLRARPWDTSLSWWIRCGVGAGPRRGSLLEALVRLNAREAVPDLLELLREEPESSADIVSTLRFLRDPAAWPALLDHLQKHADPYSDPNTWPEAWGRLSRLLLSQAPDLYRHVPYSTAELLGDLGAKGFVPDLVRLLHGGPRGYRHAAARALCLLGSDQGVALILAESEHGNTGGLLPLNALRRRGLWSRMTETRFPRTASLSKKGLWEEIARSLGVRLELANKAYSRPSEDYCERFDVLSYENLFSLADVARELLAGTSYQMILEDDRIRIVRETEALQFWTAWPRR